MLLGGVFKATGNQSPINIPAKGAWMMTDLPRFAQRYGVPYVRNPHFPINTLNLDARRHRGGDGGPARFRTATRSSARSGPIRSGWRTRS